MSVPAGTELYRVQVSYSVLREDGVLESHTRDLVVPQEGYFSRVAQALGSLVGETNPEHLDLHIAKSGELIE